MAKKLYRIEIKKFKTFYVEAENQEDALSHPALDTEESDVRGRLNWNHDETAANEQSDAQAAYVRDRLSNEIIQ